ncbi:hypothetical protein Tco_1311833 [Tanacetum coccineum]
MFYFWKSFLGAARTGRPWVNAKSKIKTEYPTVQYSSWTVNKWMDKPSSRAVGISYHCPKQCCNVLEGTRHTTAQAIVMTAAAKLAVAAAQLARYVDGSLPSEAIGDTSRGSLHSKGTGQMSHSKAATLLTFVTVEAPSVTLYIKHNYKATVAAAECVMLREIQKTMNSCTGQVTDATVQSPG